MELAQGTPKKKMTSKVKRTSKIKRNQKGRQTNKVNITFTVCLVNKPSDWKITPDQYIMAN